MKKKAAFIDWTMKYNRLVLLIVTVLIVFGIYALVEMPKREFPAVTIRQGVVVGVYPGATSAEVEEQLAKPLENFLFTYKEVKKSKTYSWSKDGIVYVFVELNDDVYNKDEVWSKIKHGLTTFKMQLPLGVLALIANDDFGDTSALLITLESDTKTYRQLEEQLEILEGKLRSIESVSNLRRYGTQKEQISIYIEKEKLATYGISVLNLYQTLITKGFITLSGKIDNKDMVVPIHIERPYLSEKDIEEQIVYSDVQGNHIRLKDIAKVVREYPKPDSYITNNGKKCLVLSTEMREGFNIVQYGKDVDAVLQEFQESLPEDISIYRIADQPKVVDSSVSNFLKELLLAITAVILVVVILLPLRVAAVSASSIPITIFIAIGLLFAAGFELNIVTLAALIVTLGMIVDNSVVIVDDYLRKLNEGESRKEAALESAREYVKAIASATLAICLAFLPFLFVLSGIIRDFIVAFPWTILLTLGISWAVAVLVIPFLQYFFIRKGLRMGKDEKPKKGTILLEKFQNSYEWLLAKVFRYPKISILVTVATIVAGIIIFMDLPLKLLPIAERDQFAVEIYLPEGSSLQQTEAVSKDMEGILRADERVVSVTAFYGAGSPRFHTAYAPKIGGPNFVQFIVNTTSNRDTEEILDDYADKYAHHYPNAFVKFKQLEYVPTDGDVEIRLAGDNISDLKQFADTLMTELNKLEEPVRIYTSFAEPLQGVKVSVDPIESSRLGVSEAILGINLASRFADVPITTVWENDYSLPVVLKSNSADMEAADVANEYVSGILSPAVPLRQIADVSPDWNEGQIVRRNGIRTLSVYVDMKRDEAVSKVQSKVETIVDDIAGKVLPEGVSISYGGVEEFNNENLPGIVRGLIIAAAIMFLVMVFHFKKISLALLVLASISFSIFGVALGMSIAGLPISATAILGMVSLIGIIVRNGIIMFDYTEELRRTQHKTVREAAILSGQRRLRPIFLTSAAASMGVIPMIISQSPLWNPMGTVIFSGTIVSMIFVVTILPLVYWLVYRHKDEENGQSSISENAEA
ncbi:efflux RND transporter permease subunit [Proteiniphilum sp.]|uniref:efflux RND transporter permease subunit n=1 Tax=Proteiniphilum sp. TaxID=1926877 RepID=UPI002B20732D|nr:efflux RND transporter permease subunit [Proteiniphilum sp.]MEA4918441.1 efflux RND transporter permease subunit [Proteiniphilum sp.]